MENDLEKEVLESMTQPQLEWLAERLFLALDSAKTESKTKRALKKQTESVERLLLTPVGREIYRRKMNG